MVSVHPIQNVIYSLVSDESMQETKGVGTAIKVRGPARFLSLYW